MEDIRIAVIDTADIVQAFLDNSAADALHYYDDTLHLYLSGAAYTYTFKAEARHEDSVYLTVGNKLAFRRNGKDYYLNIMSCVRDEETVEIEAYSLTFELLNEYVRAYSATKAMTFAEYLNAFDGEHIITLGNNEVSTKSIKNEWDGTATILNRLLSLGNVFGAELEFVPVLNKNYTLNKLILNVYEEHDDTTQGIGTDRTDIILRYGTDVEGITKTTDATDLYTAIRPNGTDGLTISSIEAEVLDDEGNVEFFTKKGNNIIYAPQARDRLPSNTLSSATDRYILYIWDYDTENVNTLYGQALAQLKANCDPQITYEVEGYFPDLDIGDTVKVYDEEFTPPLYLSARVSEQEISFTDPDSCKTTMSNFTELESGIDSELLNQVKTLIEASKTYTCTISSNNGIVFKNGEGETTLTAQVMNGTVDVTSDMTITWQIDGADQSVGTSITIQASDVDGKAVYAFRANDANGTLRGSCEVTVSNVSDGAAGAKGDKGDQGEAGAAGNGIVSVVDYYALSTSNGTAPTDWKDTVQTMTVTNRYLWSYELITYTNGSTSKTDPRVIGVYGDTGAQGKQGEQGIQGEQGKQGETGAAGADALTVVVTASNGTVFKNNSGSTILTAHVYKGGVEQSITDVGVCGSLGSIKWYKGGTAVATAKTLTVSAGDVTNSQAYTCQLEE